MKSLLATTIFLFMSITCIAQTDSHMQAVNELMEAMHMEQQLKESTERTIKVQAQSMPQVAQYQDVMKEFFNKYITWEKLGDDIKKAYKESFTEQEIRDLTSFFKTESGQKYAKIMPELSEKLALMSNAVVMENQFELQQMIMDAMSEQ